MTKKPALAEFEMSDRGVRHRPTDERFVPHPGKPADGLWRDGHAKGAEDYDQDEVRRMGRKLWAKHIAKRKNARR